MRANCLARWVKEASIFELVPFYYVTGFCILPLAFSWMLGQLPKALAQKNQTLDKKLQIAARLIKLGKISSTKMLRKAYRSVCIAAQGVLFSY